MGCDIHAYTEIKIKGVWHLYNHPRITRHYSLFSRMADVRNSEPYIEPISKPRGLPEDISLMTKFCRDYDVPDGHSHSWLSAAEVSELVIWYDHLMDNNKNGWFSFEHNSLGYIFGNGWEPPYPPNVEDVRLVFWFDN